MSLTAREQIKLIYDLIKAKFKFSHHGGCYVRCEDGRRFYTSHWRAAKDVIKIQKDRRKNPYGKAA